MSSTLVVFFCFFHVQSGLPHFFLTGCFLLTFDEAIWGSVARDTRTANPNGRQHGRWLQLRNLTGALGCIQWKLLPPHVQAVACRLLPGLFVWKGWYLLQNAPNPTFYCVFSIPYLVTYVGIFFGPPGSSQGYNAGTLCTAGFVVRVFVIGWAT